MTGLRKTKLKGLHQGAVENVIEDDYKESGEPHRLLQERWIGETWCELKPEARPNKVKRAAKPPGNPALEKEISGTDQAEGVSEGGEDQERSSSPTQRSEYQPFDNSTSRSRC